MNTKTTLPISQARKHIFDIAEEVQKQGIQYTLTEKGKPKAVIMSADEFESWAETLEIMQEFPNLKKDLTKVDRDIKSGAYRKYSTLDDILAKSGYVKSGKLNKKYEVRDQVRKKSRKRAE